MRATASNRLVCGCGSARGQIARRRRYFGGACWSRSLPLCTGAAFCARASCLRDWHAADEDTASLSRGLRALISGARIHISPKLGCRGDGSCRRRTSKRNRIARDGSIAPAGRSAVLSLCAPSRPRKQHAGEPFKRTDETWSPRILAAVPRRIPASPPQSLCLVLARQLIWNGKSACFV